MTNPLTVETLINWMWEFEYTYNSRADQSALRNRFSRQIARLNEDAYRADTLARDLAAAVVRADKAERERDEATRALGEALDSHDETLRAIAEGKYATNPRPLTPDAITDEMADRFIAAYMAESGPLPAAIRAGLVAMHTPPPSRPEGAEDIEALIRDAENAGEGADNEALANYLAARLTDPTVKEQS